MSRGDKEIYFDFCIPLLLLLFEEDENMLSAIVAFLFLSVVIILPGELLQTDKHQHKYHNLCKFQGR